MISTIIFYLYDNKLKIKLLKIIKNGIDIFSDAKFSLLRYNFLLTSVLYFDLAIVFLFPLNGLADDDGTQILIYMYLLFAFIIPKIFILLILRSARSNILEKKLDNTYKYVNYFFSILISLIIFSDIKKLIILYSDSLSSDYQIGFIPFFALFLYFGFTNFLRVIKNYSFELTKKNNIIQSGVSEQIFFGTKKEFLPTNLERIFFIFVKWSFIYGISTVSISFLLFVFFDFYAIRFLLFVLNFIGFLVCLLGFFINSYFLLTNKSFKPVWNNLKTFWKINVDYSPSVKVYNFIKNKFRNK